MKRNPSSGDEDECLRSGETGKGAGGDFDSNCVMMNFSGEAHGHVQITPRS